MFGLIWSLFGWLAAGAVAGLTAVIAAWYVFTPADAPHGGGLVLPGLMAVGVVVGSALGVGAGLVAAIRRRRRGEPPPKVGLF